jgi:hypothetical protein
MYGICHSFNIMESVIWNYFRLLMLSRSRYFSALKKVVADISRPKKSQHYFDALNKREIGRSFSDSRVFMAGPVSIDGKSILSLYYSTLQKLHKSK